MLSFLHQLFPLLLQLAGGSAGAWFFTEAVKKAKFIPINEGQKVRLRATAAVASTVLGVLVAYSNNALTPGLLQEATVALLSTGAMWWGAHTIHSSMPSANS